MSVDTAAIREILEYNAIVWVDGGGGTLDAEPEIEALLDLVDALTARVETAERAAVWGVYHEFVLDDCSHEKTDAVCATLDIAKSRIADLVKGFSSYNPDEPIEYWEYEGDFEAYQGVDGSRRYFDYGYRRYELDTSG